MTLAHMPLADLANRLQGKGLTVVIRPRSQGKAARKFTAGYYRGCQAVVMHHTGSSGLSPSGDIGWIDGKGGSDPGFVIANGYIARDGTVTLIASGPTYTEGAGGPWGLIPSGRANDVAFSYEIGGTTKGTYPHVQQHASLIAAQVTCELAAELWAWYDDPYNPHRLFTHFEWAPDRKVDVGGFSRWSVDGNQWDFDKFRADTAALATPEPPPEEPDMTPRYFRIEGAPIPVWVTTDGVIAFQVQGPTYGANGNPAAATISQADAAKFSYVDTLHPAVVGVK